MRYIPVEGSDAPAIVDDEDYDRVAAHRWRLDHIGRIVTYTPCTRHHKHEQRDVVFLSRFIVQPSERVTVLRRNGDSLDNRRANLKARKLHGKRR